MQNLSTLSRASLQCPTLLIFSHVPTRGRTNGQIVDAIIKGQSHWWPVMKHDTELFPHDVTIL